tara:strand:- start:317 stop:619 length:303 start_codon:yes stop_codon:yes gene_type:complete
MRRKFNQSLLPKEPPKVHKPEYVQYKNVFNKWFCKLLHDNNLTVKEFCALSQSNYNTAICWKKRNKPHLYGQIEIAKAMEKLGLGEYPDLIHLVKAICRK